MAVDELTVFAAVVGARFLLPLLIPKYPLPAVVSCLILDGIDQTIFQTLGYDPPGYQGYDKAMDMYYLAIAYLSTLRNWTNDSAVGVARFLYFYRLVGVVAFELTDWRPLLVEPAEVPGIEKFDTGSVTIRMTAKTLPLKQWDVARELRRRLKRRFEQENIEVPVATQTLVWDGAERLPHPAHADVGALGAGGAERPAATVPHASHASHTSDSLLDDESA